ncbi:hypothetical protein CTI12_AA174890 [Artemisia annua]|uniref:Uncharacterized protein n=1 Tax=Artemisia annua TaxID=35608 RepID=A0A2U1PAF2_ARTAN|nr:hypothetical protein CTI12_AA174890 [Artemisia annua]
MVCKELSDLIENGFKETHPEKPNQQLRDNRKKDAKALFFIQQAADDLIFTKIAVATTSTEAWETLKREYMGGKKALSLASLLLVSTLVMVSKSRVARKDLGLDLGGIGVGGGGDRK